MQALYVADHGGPEVLTLGDRPRPEIGEDEVLLQVRAAGMNHLDIWVRKGVEGHTFPLPMILGSDGAGEVVEVGARVLGVRVGDRCAISPGFAPRPTAETLAGDHHLDHDYGIFGETRDGTCAEYLSAPAANLLAMPGGMSFTDAAAIPLASLTAHHMIAERARVRPGMDVLVHAAGSGVSVYAIQFAKLYGARVFATSSSADKLAKAEALGVDFLMNYAEEDWNHRVKTETNRRGVDVVIDHVGEATFSKSLRALARGGSVVTCGATSGPKLEADLRLVFFKSLSILGSTMGGMGEMMRVWKMACRGQIRPVVDRVLPLSQAADGHRALEERAAFGKVILVPGE
ncbi:MAG: alcohol dehydrogenase [Planctomycetes bacterium]|nr:alcohol dehydrogenase [Planctomycetota bacterium]